MQTSATVVAAFAYGVFHRYSESRNAASPQLPYRTVSRSPTASSSGAQSRGLLDGAAPYHTATCAWTSGRSVYSIHITCSSGAARCDDIIHVSAQPVTPSDGITASTGRVGLE